MMSASICTRLVALLITPFTSVIYAGSNYGFLTRGIDTEMTFVNVSDMMGVHVDELALLPNAVSPPPHMSTNSTFGWDPFIPNERDPFDTRLWNLSISTFDSNYQHVDCNISISAPFSFPPFLTEDLHGMDSGVDLFSNLFDPNRKSVV